MCQSNLKAHRPGFTRRRPGVIGNVAIITLILAGGANAPAWSVTYYFATDVPANLGGADYTPDQIVRSDNASYAPVLSIGDPGFAFLAIHRRPDGLWLLVPATPVPDPPNPAVESRDVVLFDGVSPTLYFSGASAGVPADTRIDAVLLDESGALVLSFDVPVDLNGVLYSQSDLVRYAGGVFSLYFDADAAGLPRDSNIVGADRDDAGVLVVTFDVPTLIGGTEFLPGQLVSWAGAGFAPYFTDVGWPVYAQLRDFAFVPPSGAVPDGGGLPGVPLTVSRAGSNLTLSWGTSCVAGDTDYEVYEGFLGAFYSHAAKFCTTGGATSISFPEPPGSAYYLVVPRNALSEGSYGLKSDFSERPQGAFACLEQLVTAQCP